MVKVLNFCYCFSTYLKPIANQTSIRAGAGAVERTEVVYKTLQSPFRFQKLRLF